MNKENLSKNVLLWLVALLVVGFGAYTLGKHSTSNSPSGNGTVNNNSGVSQTLQIPKSYYEVEVPDNWSAGVKVADGQSQKIFADNRIQISVPKDWFIQLATAGVGGEAHFSTPVGVTLTKGDYRISLISDYDTTDPLSGGQFGDVAMYTAPWVSQYTGRGACGRFLQREITPVKNQLSRVDLYLNTASSTSEALNECGNPLGSGMLWYGSFYTNICPAGGKANHILCGAYFMTYIDIAGKDFPKRLGIGVSKAAYAVGYRMKSNSRQTPSSLLTKGDPILGNILKDADDIINSLTYK